MTLEQAEKYAGLWAAGKLIGGDAYEVSVTLFDEIRRLRATLVAERERCAKICETMPPDAGPHAYAYAIRKP